MILFELVDACFLEKSKSQDLIKTKIPEMCIFFKGDILFYFIVLAPLKIIHQSSG